MGPKIEQIEQTESRGENIPKERTPPRDNFFQKRLIVPRCVEVTSAMKWITITTVVREVQSKKNNGKNDVSTPRFFMQGSPEVLTRPPFFVTEAPGGGLFDRKLNPREKWGPKPGVGTKKKKDNVAF